MPAQKPRLFLRSNDQRLDTQRATTDFYGVRSAVEGNGSVCCGLPCISGLVKCSCLPMVFNRFFQLSHCFQMKRLRRGKGLFGNRCD